jgi:hypothetical protein
MNTQPIGTYTLHPSDNIPSQQADYKSITVVMPYELMDIVVPI